MDLSNSSPAFTDPVPISQSMLGLSSNLMPYSVTSAGYASSSLSVNVPRRKLLPGKLEEVLATGWLDAMKSSSPRKKLNTHFSHDMPSDEDPAYSNWLVKCPSALASFKQITGHARGKKIALFLDYDGTLSPIVDDPDRAFMSPAMRAAVKNVAKYFPTAIISGRARVKVFEFVKLKELYYAGSHGMDIMASAGKYEYNSTDKHHKDVNIFQPACEFLLMIDEVFKSLTEATKGIEGAKIENNKFCVSVHYRNVTEKDWNLVAQLVNDVLKAFPRLKLTYGRMVLEVRPVIDWNKGKAVEFLLESLGFCDCDDVLPIYIGDDHTDEDAFRVLREQNRGYGVLVSSVPRETEAFYSLRDPSEVMEFLNLLVRWKKRALSQNLDRFAIDST